MTFDLGEGTPANHRRWTGGALKNPRPRERARVVCQPRPLCRPCRGITSGIRR